jgi:hypothetical protein
MMNQELKDLIIAMEIVTEADLKRRKNLLELADKIDYFDADCLKNIPWAIHQALDDFHKEIGAIVLEKVCSRD